MLDLEISLEILVIVVIAYFQVKTYVKIKRALSSFREIFPRNAETEWNIQKSSENGVRIIPLSELSLYGNSIRIKIFEAINKFLEKNKYNVTDFSLIKDIIDRNSQAEEDAIQTQIPIPLYLGLIGTMLGILLGVLSLVVGGVANIASSDGEKSINGLLLGVVIAMGSSILGNLLTIEASKEARETKKAVEERKNNFYSWLQAELLPKISSDLSSALIRLGNDLTTFNDSFKSNADILNTTIAKISESTNGQEVLLSKFVELKITEIATANVKACNKLSDFSAKMESVKENILNVNNNLEKSIKEYETRKEFIKNATGEIDIALQNNLEELKKIVEDTSSKYSTLFGKFDITIKEIADDIAKSMKESSKQIAEDYGKAIDDLHKKITDKLTDFTVIEDELKNLTGVKENIAELTDTTQKQNEKLDIFAETTKRQNEDITKAVIRADETNREAFRQLIGEIREQNMFFKGLVVEILIKVIQNQYMSICKILEELIAEVRELADSNKQGNKDIIQAIKLVEQNSQTSDMQLIKEIRDLEKLIQKGYSAVPAAPSNIHSSIRDDSAFSKEIRNLAQEIHENHAKTSKMVSVVTIACLVLMILRILSIFGLV